MRLLYAIVNKFSFEYPKESFKNSNNCDYVKTSLRDVSKKITKNIIIETFRARITGNLDGVSIKCR